MFLSHICRSFLSRYEYTQYMYTVQLNYRIPKELSLEYCTVPRESQTLFLFLRKQSHLGPYTSRIYLHFQLFPRCIGDTVFPRTVASACERVCMSINGFMVFP